MVIYNFVSILNWSFLWIIDDVLGFGCVGLVIMVVEYFEFFVKSFLYVFFFDVSGVINILDIVLFDYSFMFVGNFYCVD